jgi:2'-5' RNA ligase
MHRLFVAIRPPAPIRAQLLDIAHGVSAARWQDDDQLHLTLRFIGEVDRHRAEDVAAALDAVHHPPFAVSLDGIGRFETRGKGTLWAGVSPHDELHALHKKVAQACLRVGIEEDTRAYLPHITLARTGRHAGPIDSFATMAAGLASAPFIVDWFGLFESMLTSDGAVYTLVERYPLGPSMPDQ